MSRLAVAQKGRFGPSGCLCGMVSSIPWPATEAVLLSMTQILHDLRILCTAIAPRVLVSRAMHNFYRPQYIDSPDDGANADFLCFGRWRIYNSAAVRSEGPFWALMGC